MKNFKSVGIPLKEVGPRLQALHDAIEEHDMAIGADAQYNVNFMIGRDNVVSSVTMTVYFFEKGQEATERLEPHVEGDNHPDCATCKWAEEGTGKLRYRCKNPNKVVQRNRCWEEKEDGTQSN